MHYNSPGWSQRQRIEPCPQWVELKSDIAKDKDTKKDKRTETIKAISHSMHTLELIKLNMDVICD